jgi:hypothetical protein
MKAYLERDHEWESALIQEFGVCHSALEKNVVLID